MRPVRNVFQKLSRTEQRREGVVAYLWVGAILPCWLGRRGVKTTGNKIHLPRLVGPFLTEQELTAIFSTKLLAT
jgi:hypothetical protein